MACEFSVRSRGRNVQRIGFVNGPLRSFARIISAAAIAVTAAVAWVPATAIAIGPDLIVGDIYGVSSYGSVDGISAFAFGHVSCNIGDAPLDFYSDTNQHPVVGHSMYRLKNDRFEQIGQNWLEHGYYALSENFCLSDCHPIQPMDGTQLGVHCSDTSAASINGVQSILGPRYEVNAHTGVFTFPPANPPYSGSIARRLQVKDSDLDAAMNAGSLYFVESHHVTQDDAAAGNGNNNASYRRVFIYEGTGGACPVGRYCLTLSGVLPTQRTQPAIRAWNNYDNSVVETDAQVPGDGLFILSAKVTEMDDGYFHYEYALQNLNSDRSGGSFTVPIFPGASIRNISFHDVDYHDGDGVACPGCTCAGGDNSDQACLSDADCPLSFCDGSHINFDGTDWAVTVDRCRNIWSTITWSTTPYAVDPNANALRWGTLYNFRFDADIGPNDVTVTLGLFKPGASPQVSIRTVGPSLPPTADFDRDGDIDLSDAAGLQGCFSAEKENPDFVIPSEECLLRFDFDNDEDVDLADYKSFFSAYSGP